MYICRKMRLCTYLLEKGFKYEEEKADRFNPKFNIWLFKNSPELLMAVEEYYKGEYFIHN